MMRDSKSEGTLHRFKTDLHSSVVHLHDTDGVEELFTQTSLASLREVEVAKVCWDDAVDSAERCYCFTRAPTVEVLEIHDLALEDSVLTSASSNFNE